MSFFDKLFSHKNRNNKNENVLKAESEHLSFKSSHLTIPKDQIRFILFRECERRGRKLLFDSNAVEKIPLPSRGIMCNQKCQQQSDKIIDFIETTKTHGYKYKKPSNDVASLGEMVFGSVAVVYKGESSSKIHSIPSPKRLMFTTIVHAPNRCPVSTTSDCNTEGSRESSLASLNEIINKKQSSSSDSKLYRREGVGQKYSSTYPWIKHNSPINKITQCCDISDVDSKLRKNSFLQINSEIGCLESLCLGKRTNESEGCGGSGQEGKTVCEKLCRDREFPVNSLSLSQKNSDCEGDSPSNYDSSVVVSNESETVSSVSGSLSSLRRRWAHSYSTSLDSTAYEDTSSSPSRKKTKLGMALVLDLTNTLEEEMEKFLFNHTIVIDSVMSKLQSAVEFAYIRNENFVDLIYTAFLESQQSIHELITGGKFETPIWYTLIGGAEVGLGTPLIGKNVNEERISKQQDLLNRVQLKFLNDFCDVLAKFDTKDTNFFISTLLTAVLTHHLSWVTSIAETDTSTPNEKLSVIKNVRPYNPIWAQLNDLCGLLGSPLKCAKTVITGSEGKKSQLAAVIQVLTYFIRCYNVVENIYDVDIEDIIGNADREKRRSNLESFDSAIESDVHNSSARETLEGKFASSRIVSESETEKSSDEDRECGSKLTRVRTEKSGSKKNGSECGLKRSKSYLSHMKGEDKVKLYPDIKDMAKSENIKVTDLNQVESETTIFVENILNPEKLTEKVKKLMRVPIESVKPHLEGYLSPDEGYDTIDSTKTENFTEKKVRMERQCSAPEGKKDNIVFVLGENEELVNVRKKVVVNKSTLINIEKEDSKEFVFDSGRSFSSQEACANSDKGNRTCENSSETVDRTLWVKNVEHSPSEGCNEENTSLKIPWMARELRMPRITKPCRSRRLEVSSVLGGVNQVYNSEQVIQGIIDPKDYWKNVLQKDLFLCAHNPILEKDISEALCIVGDMESWEVSIFSSCTSLLNRNKETGVRVGMSQLVADMLESLFNLHAVNLSPNFCLVHIEKKLREIYSKSKTVAELLNSTELCSIDYLTTRLDISINDVPLLLSVATTHSPHLAEKYGLSFT